MIQLFTMPLRTRVWDIEKKEFVKPSAFSIDGEGELSVREKLFLSDGTMTYHDLENEWGRFVVSQFTGMVDSNGDHIYTGDLLGVVGHKEVYQVCYVNGQVCAYQDDYFAGRVWELVIGADKFEVIGNIWQNPELVKRSKNG